jgi:hypothetical protein
LLGDPEVLNGQLVARHFHELERPGLRGKVQAKTDELKGGLIGMEPVGTDRKLVGFVVDSTAFIAIEVQKSSDRSLEGCARFLIQFVFIT